MYKVFYGDQEVFRNCLYTLSNGKDQFKGMILSIGRGRRQFWVFNGFKVDDTYRSHLPFQKGLEKGWEIHSWDILNKEGIIEWRKLRDKIPCKLVSNIPVKK